MVERLFGIDGCRSGWVIAESDLSIRHIGFELVSDLGAWLSALHPPAVLIAIDVPIGLETAAARACDQAARARLGVPRQNSVFSAPCRETLDSPDFASASAINRRLRGKGITRQWWGILPKIKRVDRLLEQIPSMAERIWEAHPEVTFADLAGSRHGLEPGKATPDGEKLRRTLLAQHGLEIDPVHIRLDLGLALVKRDDIPDAAACLLTARHLASGTARLYPPSPAPTDRQGLRMQIAS